MSALVALDTLLATRTLWHAGRSAAIAADGEPTGHAALDALLPQGGWPRRALTELLLPADGVGELSLLLPTLSRATQDGARVVLVAPPYLPYAPAWQAAGVDLSQLCIVEAGARDALWAFEQCLRSGACAAVLGWPQQADARALRRLQVAADSGQCLGFALRDRRHAANPSPAALRLEAVRAEQGIAWQVRKCRGGPVPAMPFVAGTGKDPSRLASEISARRALDTPSPASGGGLGWGPAGRDANPRASGAPPSAFGPFPRERGKEKTAPDTHQDPSHLVEGVPPRRATNAPSPANGGGGLGWGPASRDANPRASGAPPSVFGTFPREREKEEAAPDAVRVASQEACHVASLRPLAFPGNVAPLPATASAHAPGQEPEWRQEPMGNALLATKGSHAAPPRTFAAATRRASPHPQHELQFAPAPLARD